MLFSLLFQTAAAGWAPQPAHQAQLAAAQDALTRYELDTAIEGLSAILAADPDCGAARWRLGQALVHSRRPDDARPILVALQADFPERLEPALALAWAGLAEGDPDRVEVAASMADHIAPDDPEPDVLLAWAAAASGDVATARERLAPLADVREASCVRARLDWAQGDHVSAAVALVDCERAAPLLLVRDTRLALLALQLPEADPGPDGPSELDMELHRGARDLLLADRPADALALLEILLRRYPRDLNALIWAGRCHEKLGNPLLAQAYYDRVLRSDWRALYLDGRAEGVLAWTEEEGVRAGLANVARRQALLLHQADQTETARLLLAAVEADVGSWPALALAAEELNKR